MKKREFTLKVTFSLPSPSSMLKLPFYYILSTFNSKMDAENSLLELEAVEVPAVNKTAGRKRKQNFSAQEIAKIYSSRV